MEYSRLDETCSAASRLLNAIFGGDATMSVSAQAGKDNNWLKPWIDGFCWSFLLEWNHCDEAYEEHVKRARKTLNEWMLEEAMSARNE